MRDQQNCYVFEVDRNANKIEIRRSIEELFNVKVKDVATMNVRGKMKRLGRFVGKRPNWKKAIVTLAKDQSISQLENI
jgi:large subunit ribosomal protein L23